MSNLLNDAMAEAKSIKRLALANAKATLEETYSPQIQRLVSAKLSEEADEDFDEEEVDVEPQPAPKEDSDDTGFGEIDAEFTSDNEEDLELESLIRELEGEDEEMMESDDLDLEEGDEEDWNEPVQESDEDEIYEMIMRELEGSDDEMMTESDDDGGIYTERPPQVQNNTESRKIRQENKQLKRKLNEALSVVTSLKKTINEVNLLNAKLMFNTRVNKSYELNKNQKTTVLEALDRANNVREVKLVYTTIVESLNKTTKLRKNPITEGYGSKVTPAIKQPKKDEFNFVPRWKELAGIK